MPEFDLWIELEEPIRSFNLPVKNDFEKNILKFYLNKEQQQQGLQHKHNTKLFQFLLRHHRL